MAELKNIIFDLGGVLLDIDYSKTEKAFQQLGFEHFKICILSIKQMKFLKNWKPGI